MREGQPGGKLSLENVLLAVGRRVRKTGTAKDDEGNGVEFVEVTKAGGREW